MAEYTSQAELPEQVDEEFTLRLRRAETLARIGAESRFDRPFVEVLEALSANIVQETRAISAAVILMRPADLSIIAQGGCNLPDGYLEGAASSNDNPERAARLRSLVDEHGTWVTRDARTHLLSVPALAYMREINERVAFDTIVTTAFLDRPETLGIICLYYSADVEVDEQETAFAKAIAEQAAPVMDNAWLFNQIERRTEELEALSRADQAMHQSIRLEDVYQAMIDLAVELFGADRSLFLTFDESDRLHCLAARGVDGKELAELQKVWHEVKRSRFANRGPELSIAEDTQNDPRVNAGVRKVTSSASSVDIPVFVGGEFFGNFVLGYRNRRTFSEEDKQLFHTLSARAGLAIQNALLFEEAQRRSNELEALSRADQALHESLVLEDVYQAMIDLSIDLLGADHSLFLTFDDAGIFHAAAARGVPAEHLAGLQPIYAAVLRSRFDEGLPGVVVVEDVDNNGDLLPGARTFTNSRSTVDVNVFLGGEFFGMFVLGYHTRRAFTENDRALFATLSARASVAIQNALLFKETQRRTNELEALYHADEALHRSLRLEDVLDAMVELAIELLGASSSLVVTWDESDRLGIRASRGVRQEQREDIHARYQEFNKEHFAQFERPYRASLIEDVKGHPKINLKLKVESPGSLAEIPVMVGEELWGFFSVGWREHRTFNDDDRRMFDAFAARASLAIQNANLFEQAQVSASLEERQRIARELHDSVSQALYGIGLGGRTAKRRLGAAVAPEVLEPLDYIIQLAESGLAETRALIFELIPESLEEQGLVLALQRQAAATQSRYRIEVEAVLGDEPDIPIRAKEALYRIAQESLHNMAKHAEASHASVGLYANGGEVTLVVRDDGKGFDTGAEFPGHFGLRSMEERAKRIGATFVIVSTPGQGTTATVTVPAQAASPSRP